MSRSSVRSWLTLLLCVLLAPSSVRGGHSFLSVEDAYEDGPVGESRNRLPLSKYSVIVHMMLDGLNRTLAADNLKESVQYLLELGEVFYRNGDYDSAAARFAEAAALARSSKDDRVGLALAKRGRALHLKSDYAGAMAQYQAALDFHRKGGPRQTIAEEDTLVDIGILRRDMGDYAGALDSFQQSLKLYQKMGGGRTEKGWIYREMARVYRLVGEADKALYYLKRALPITVESERKNDEAVVLIDLAAFHLERGDAAAALDPAQKAAAAAAAIKFKPLAREAERALAEVHMAQGRTAQAAEIFKRWEDGFGLGRAALASGDLKEALRLLEASAAAGGPARTVLANQIALGLALERSGRRGEAFKRFQGAAVLAEEVRSSLPEGQRLHFLSTREAGFPLMEAYEGMVRTAPTEAASFEAAEHGRARQLMESIVQRGAGDASAGLPPELSEKEKALSRRLAGALILAQGALSTGHEALLRKSRAEAADAAADLEKFVARLRKEQPAYAALHYPQPLSAGQVALRPGEALIEYEVTETGTRLFLLKDGKLSSFNVPVARKDLGEKVRRYRAFFESVGGTGDLAAFDPRLGRELYDLLLKPVLGAKPGAGPVAPGDRLLIVPDEVLGLLPFEALVWEVAGRWSMPAGRFGPAPVGVSYVADAFDVGYAPSATALTLQRALPPARRAPRKMLVVADPVFARSDPRASGAAAGPSDPYVNAQSLAVVKRMGVGGRRAEDGPKEFSLEEPSFLRLDRTGILAADLAGQVFKGEKVDILAGFDASEEMVRRRDLAQYEHIVFATHGILDGAVPYIREPALVLSQLRNELPFDGFLGMGEVFPLRLNAEVVALTACETGLGREVGGEGVMGLGRAFQHAGARSVLMSLWSVSEDSTTLMTRRFFERMRDGAPAREALRGARGDVRREGYEHPFYWAPFVLFSN